MCRILIPTTNMFARSPFITQCSNALRSTLRRSLYHSPLSERRLSHFVTNNVRANNIDKPGRLRAFKMSMRVMSSYKPDWGLQSIIINTNIDRWYEKPEGVYYQVNFIDTCWKIAPEIRAHFPVVLALPGSPGSHKDVISLVEPLAREGVRVIIPNFPGFDFTTPLTLKNTKYEPMIKPDLFFTQTTSERAEFLVRFLMAVDVDEIDLAIAHSAGTAPLLMFMASNDLVKASLFINAVPVHKPIRAARPVWFNSKVVTMHYGDLWRIVAYGITYLKMKWAGLQTGTSKMRYNALQLSLGIGGPGVCDSAKTLASSNKTLSYVYTTKDPYVELKLAKEYAEMLGITQENTVLLKPGEEVPSDNTSNKRALVFDAKSHYPHFNKHIRKYILEEISHLLKASLNK